MKDSEQSIELLLNL